MDAEDYYLQRIESVCQKIALERRRSSRGNSGFGFVSFQSNLQVKKCLLGGHFKRLMMENLSPDDRLKSKCMSWAILAAPSQCDILWENLKNRSFTDHMYLILINIFMVLLCVFVLSPLPIIGILQNWLSSMEKPNETNYLIKSL
jgi:hypothetical protein